MGILLIAGGRAGRGSRIAHGPFMLSGAAIAVLVGEVVWRAYLTFTGMG